MFTCYYESTQFNPRFNRRSWCTRTSVPLLPAYPRHRHRRNLHSLSVHSLNQYHSLIPPAGVKVETITPGDGITFPQKGDTVSMHCQYHNNSPQQLTTTDVGTLLANGQQFDSSRDRNSVFKTQIGVGAVIKGWDQGVPQMSLGEKANLIIGSDFGYGKRGGQSFSPPPSARDWTNHVWCSGRSDSS